MTGDAAKKELRRRVEERAYRIWLDEGRPDDKSLEHWLRAKREVEEEAAVINGTEDLNG